MHGTSVSPGQWKREETTGNDVVAQRDFGGVIEAELHAVPAAILARLTLNGALNECLRHDGRSDEAIAARLHICKGYMSKLLRCVWEAQIKRLIRFMRETRCIAPLQVIAREVGCDVVQRTAQQARIAQLEAALADERRRAAAA